MAKNIFLLSIGFVVGLAIALPGGLLFLRTEAGQEILRSYVVPVPEWPDVSSMLSTNATTLSVNDVLSNRLTVAVPTALVSDTYGPALNGVVGNVQQLATTSNELGPLLIEMNARSLSGNYEGFFDLVVRAKILLAQQHTLSAHLSSSLSDLSMANQKTVDPTLKTLTNSVVTAAAPFTRDLEAHLNLLDQLLSGKVPSVALINSINDSASRLAQDIESFGTELQKLTGRLSGSAR